MSDPQPVSPAPAPPLAPFQSRFLLPRYWGIWLGFALLWCLTFLPWPAQRQLGCWIGELVWQLGKKRRNDTLTNLRLCFPELSEEARTDMAVDVFRNAGIGLFESLNAWYKPSHFHRKVTIAGLHHLTEAQAEGKSILLLGAHYTMLDAGGLICRQFFPAAIVYRPQNNPLLEWLISHARQRLYSQQLDHDNMRGLVRALRNKQIVWYTPDQDFGLHQGIMAPFFGVPAATITATRRLAALDQSAVMAIHFYRQDDKRPHYHITITRALDHYPSADVLADTTRVNQLLESLIRIAPDQYMWFHRRFKTRPPGEASVYLRSP